ncbi:cytochrome c oxidase subunit II [Deinococcus sp. YIM 134068]|uniref:cytochrome c oxidase subunit II n=1 Tax=Deinococcus lichenicola TaxID=3118910 RepID=UPI002F94BCD2
MAAPHRPVRRLDHRTLERYENIWLGIAVVLLLLLFASVFSSMISGTFPLLRGTGGGHAGGVTSGRVDPRNLAATPFAKPGLRENADGSLEAFVVARAFNFEPAVLRVPAGRPVTIHVTAADVVHGYYVTGTNINAEILPGHVASFTLTFRRPGEQSVICNEYCGIGHHGMITRVVVDPPTARSRP